MPQHEQHPNATPDFLASENQPTLPVWMISRASRIQNVTPCQNLTHFPRRLASDPLSSRAPEPCSCQKTQYLTPMCEMPPWSDTLVPEPLKYRNCPTRPRVSKQILASLCSDNPCDLEALKPLL